MKFCKRCQAETERRPTGVCVPCHRKYNRDYKAANLGKVVEYRRRWAAANLEKERARRHRYETAHPHRSNTTNRRRRDGLPEPTRPCPELCEVRGCTRKAINLEHCHATGIFRGWTCNRHNIGMGAIGDTLEAARAVVEYLERAESDFWLAIPGNGLPLPKAS